MSWLLAIAELGALLYLLHKIFDDTVVAGISIWKAARDEAREGRLHGVTQADPEGSVKLTIGERSSSS